MPAPFYPHVRSVFTPAQGHHDLFGAQPTQVAQAHQFSTCPIWARLNSEAGSTDASEAAEAPAENPEPPSEPPDVEDAVQPHPLSHIISMSGLPQSHVLGNSLKRWQGEKNIHDVEILIQWLYDKSCEVNRLNTTDSRNWLNIVDECLCFLDSTCDKYNQLKQTDSVTRLTGKLLEFAKDHISMLC